MNLDNKLDVWFGKSKMLLKNDVLKMCFYGSTFFAILRYT